MNKHDAIELNKFKSEGKLLVNVTLLGICFTIFALVVTLKPEYLQDKFFSLQLALSIPFFMSSIFSRAKAAYVIRAKNWNMYGFFMFLVAYGFLVNIVGMLLIGFSSFEVGMAFFAINIILAIAYSSLEILEKTSTPKERFYKDFLFAIIIFAGGILPAVL